MRSAPLSPGELAHIPEFVEKWTEIGYSTAPINRDWTEGALARFYEFAGLLGAVGRLGTLPGFRVAERRDLCRDHVGGANPPHAQSRGPRSYDRSGQP
jgi:hypothetical protein